VPASMCVSCPDPPAGTPLKRVLKRRPVGMKERMSPRGGEVSTSDSICESERAWERGRDCV
jgi:hypothetical protein